MIYMNLLKRNKLEMIKQCPKCKTINPPVKEFSNTHIGSQCKHIIGIRKLLFGLLILPKFCNSINDMDEDDDWIYIKE